MGLCSSTHLGERIEDILLTYAEQALLAGSICIGTRRSTWAERALRTSLALLLWCLLDNIIMSIEVARQTTTSESCIVLETTFKCIRWVTLSIVISLKA